MSEEAVRTEAIPSEAGSEVSSLREELSSLQAEVDRLRSALAEEVNRRNEALSPGNAGTGTAGEYFTPEEVRAMSSREVHEQYARIRESMKHWR